MFRNGDTLSPRFAAMHKLSEKLGHLEALDGRQANAHGDLRRRFGSAQSDRGQRIGRFGAGMHGRVACLLRVFDLCGGLDRDTGRTLGFPMQNNVFLFSG